MNFPSPFDLLSKVQGGSSAPLFNSTASSFNNPAGIPSPQALLSQAQASSPEIPKEGFISSILGGGLRQKMADIGSAIRTKVKDVIGQSAANVQDVFTGALKATPTDYLNGVVSTFNGISHLAEGFNEGVVRIAKSAVEQVGGKGAVSAVGSVPGAREFTQLATGQPTVPTYQDIFKKANDFALNNNASLDQAKTFGSLVVIGSLFADNPISLPGKEQALKFTENAIADLAKADTDEAVISIIKAEHPDISTQAAEAVAPAFRRATTPEDVRAVADEVNKAIKSVPSKVDLEAQQSEVPHPDELGARAADNLGPERPPTPESLEPAPYLRSLQGEGDATRFIPVEGQPVHIMEGLDTFLHQPENGAYEVLEASTGRQIGKAGATAQEAVQNAHEALADKSPEDIQAAIAKHPVAPREAPAAAREVPPPAAPRPFDPNLIRSISQEELPGPVLDKLRAEFPALSDQALTPIATRLSKLKRTGDIEGVLQVIRNVSDDIARARKAAGTSAGPIRLSRDTLDSSIAKAGERQAVGDLPPSIGELMTSAERGKYLDNIQRAVKNPEQAVLAQQEYDALWEHADQRILDRYEELKIQRDLMRDATENTPGRELYKLYHGTFLSPDDYGLDDLADKMKGKKLGKEMDARIEDIMGGDQDKEAAQKALEDYRGMRAQVAEIEKEIRELRPKARAARILQSMVEDVPIIARKDAGEIEALASHDDVRKTYKDISGFMGQARDLYRNFEHTFGTRYSEVKKVILDPFDKSKGDLVDLLKEIGDDLEKNVTKKHGFNRASKESAAIQRYGDSSLPEGERINFDQLVKEFGSEKAGKIIDADGFFRDRYNTFIDRVNKNRAEIFPNDPSKLIPKRKDYYRHFQEMGDGFKAIMDLFETPAGISPELAGLSEWTKPKSKFLSFAQQRVGKSTTLDAIGGFLDYAPSYAYALHIDPHIGKFRYLRRRLAEVSPTPGVRELIDTPTGRALVEQKGINNFLEYLDNFANDLAGKTNPMDRYIQMVVPGGRKTLKVINWLNSRVKLNTILGNMSSAVAQFGNVPNGVASAKLYTIPGIGRSLAGILTPNDAMAASTFIKERYKEDLAARFKVDWVEHPIRGTTERTRDMAAWVTGALDELGTKLIWNSHYAKGLAEGAADPIKYADDITREMVGGRGIGEVPLVQKSKIFQVVAPFQLEVGNAWFVLGKFVRRRDFGAIATLVVANYLFNRAAEEIRGTPVLFDPIQSLIDGSTEAADEMHDGNPGRAAMKFAGRQVGEILSNVPFGQTVAAALPDDFVKNTLGFQGGKKELFGSADPGRFGSGLLAVSGIMDPLYRLLPPFGGAQIKRTVDGVSSMLQGQVKDAGGNLSFKTTPTIPGVIQAVLFGKNATGEAHDFYDSRDDLFTRIYRQDAQRTDVGIEAESKWAEIKKLPKDQAIEALKALDEKDSALADAVAKVAQDEAAGLTGTERLIKMLGVENGERAKYISDTIAKLPDREQQVAYLQELDTKKLISNLVFQQLQALLKGKLKPKSGTPAK